MRTEDFEKLFFVLEDTMLKHASESNKIFLPLLRISNGILNKLSSTSHTSFIARIHKLIARVFPLSHKAGVNFKGIYNERISTDPTDEDAEMEDTEQSTYIINSKEGKSTKLSYKFYKNFWLLQKYIADPIQV